MIPADFWRGFMKKVNPQLKSGAEVTMEVNPGTVEGDQLYRLRAAGFNRLSVGVQSLDDGCLRLLGRIHDAAEAQDTVRKARKAGFENLSLDLIYGIPGQTQEMWNRDLRRALELDPEHISCYQLTLEPHVPMYRRTVRGELNPCDDGWAAKMYFAADEILNEAGYEHYEVSSYCRDGDLRSRHNIRYWRRLSYTGLGPSAHSFDGSLRSWNVPSVADYANRMEKGETPVEGSEVPDERQQALEMLMLGLRWAGGVNIGLMRKRTGLVPKDSSVNTLLKREHVTVKDNTLVPTAGGMLFPAGNALMLWENLVNC